jgi:hypothetical protein
LLAGGLEDGLTHLFYVGSQINEGLLGFAVQAQLPPRKGDLESPVIVIHSNNAIQNDKLAGLSFEVVAYEPSASLMSSTLISWNSSGVHGCPRDCEALMNSMEQMPEGEAIHRSV